MYVHVHVFVSILTCIFPLALEAVQNTLTNMSTSVTVLQMNSNRLNSTLQNISASITTLLADCNSIATMSGGAIVTTAECMVLNPSLFQNGLEADYNQV